MSVEAHHCRPRVLLQLLLPPPPIPTRHHCCASPPPPSLGSAARARFGAICGVAGLVGFGRLLGATLF